jgi:hypothetical protein
VVQAALVGIADVHPGAFPHRFQSLQLVDLLRSVFLILGDSGVKRLVWVVGHLRRNSEEESVAAKGQN